MVNIAVLGYGVVGSGVVEVIKKNKLSIGKRAGEDITVKKVLDIRDFPESPDKDLLTKNADEVFKDDSIGILVETIGGIGAAYEFTKKAFMNGKHVVSSNKELVATHGPELLELAKDNGVNYLFEASVGGGIPIIRPLNQCLAANEIDRVSGILNGTTNFILTKMKRDGLSFKDALKVAQDNGFAEADPTADIEGHDACRKIAILSSIAYGEFVDYSKIHTEGITKITLTDMEYADEMDCVIKLIAMSRKIGEKVFARVSPLIISKSHALATVENEFNAIEVRGDAIGNAMFYGRGAGKLPTASAVVADVIDVAKHMDSNGRNVWERTEDNNMIDINESETKFFIRVMTRNVEEAKRFIANNLGEVDFIKLEKPELKDEVAFVTKNEKEKVLTKSVNKLKGIGSIKEVINVIRVEEE